ncbi:hypothetical protein ACLOJK_006732 [Asimina triloba]
MDGGDLRLVLNFGKSIGYKVATPLCSENVKLTTLITRRDYVPNEHGHYRSFNFQILPYCFHLIYNHISCINLSPSSSSPTPTPTINLIHSDSHVTIYQRPTLASLPMRQFLKHLICDSDSFLGQPIPVLSASDTLQLARNYFLLPSHLFQSVLSSLALTFFASRHHALKFPTCRRPFDILKTGSSSVQIRVFDEFIQSLMVRKERKDDRLRRGGREEAAMLDAGIGEGLPNAGPTEQTKFPIQQMYSNKT